MVETPLRVLLLEDSPLDAELITHELDRAGIGCVTQRVDTEGAFVHALRSFEPDIVLCDHGLARYNAMAALRTARAERSAMPIIVVTSTLDEQTRRYSRPAPTTISARSTSRPGRDRRRPIGAGPLPDGTPD
jgi:DNA-binding response OmpR family regulator